MILEAESCRPVILVAYGAAHQRQVDRTCRGRGESPRMQRIAVEGLAQRRRYRAGDLGADALAACLSSSSPVHSSSASDSTIASISSIENIRGGKSKPGRRI